MWRVALNALLKRATVLPSPTRTPHKPPLQSYYRLFNKDVQAPPKPRVPIQVTYPQFRRELKKPETVLIDVREPVELTKEGRISENAKNIPLSQLESAIQMGEDEFQAKYGFEKPKEHTPVITHCKLGIRATKAAMALTQAGYINVIIYPGIVDWTENGGDLVN